jgi:hypothetical protein
VKTPKIHIKLITSPADIKVDEIVELHCYIEGMKPTKLSWSFQSGLLPNNTHITNDGHLMIHNFDRSNLGTYTCSAETPTQHLSQSIDFQPNDIFHPPESLVSYQIYSSRSDYRLGGRLLIECLSSGSILFISSKILTQILDPNSSKFWIKQHGKSIQNISQSFLLINKLHQQNIGQYQCLSSNETKSSSISFNITQSNLLSHKFPFDKTSNLQIEFLSSIHQLKLGGNILINCSSSDQTPVQWLANQQINGITRNNSYLHISKFSTKHFNYYYCNNQKAQKMLSLSPNLFALLNLEKKDLNKYNTSLIEMIQGKYVGDNITLICRIGRGKQYFSLIFLTIFLFLDVSQGKVIWSNLPKRRNHFYIRGPRLEFRPFKLEHHNQYKCLIKSKQSNEILRTLIFNTYSNIYENNNRKPNMNLTIDTSHLFSLGELRLICNTGQFSFEKSI